MCLPVCCRLFCLLACFLSTTVTRAYIGSFQYVTLCRGVYPSYHLTKSPWQRRTRDVGRRGDLFVFNSGTKVSLFELMGAAFDTLCAPTMWNTLNPSWSFKVLPPFPFDEVFSISHC
ncbi:uncharacterized protein LY79DRAFT_544965 [Colletotrichum navitas]|uniref:Secreted protein n=1 Tax=Colletotrichum navitas TaxID=681940 RepID=A0AAD8V6F5_9PEZI|nr:uncharacterized protein LY79DRAFT_544965 [Colletotrichum navitas]KAK1595982.1 hypothetical protein LY79DRAFT_544965 [Colletotrichum navitas]